MYIDLLTKIKNAQTVGKKVLKTRFSRTDKTIADILVRQGFIESTEIKGRPSKRFIFINLRGSRDIEACVFISKPSVHEYAGYKELKSVKGGHGTLIISTPKGIMTAVEAKREKVGGELLFKIW